MSQPLTTLRGASADVDIRRAARVITLVCLVAWAALVIGLFVADVNTNAEVTELQHHGVPIYIRVTSCDALLGGSGSNAAGYRCRGTFVLKGKTYDETVPGDSLHAPGAELRVISAKNDPGLLATVRQVRDERDSWKLFVVPTALLIALLVSLIAITVRQRRSGNAVIAADNAI